MATLRRQSQDLGHAHEAERAQAVTDGSGNLKLTRVMSGFDDGCGTGLRRLDADHHRAVTEGSIRRRLQGTGLPAPRRRVCC